MDSRKDHDSITLDLSNWDQPHAANEILISDFDSMITTITPTPVPAITIDDSTSWNWNSDTITLGNLQPQGSGKIKLDGHDADIEINGESLLTMIRGIQDRLNILTPDRELEQEWDDLRVLREQYEAKLEECRAKSRVWQTLKQSG